MKERVFRQKRFGQAFFSVKMTCPPMVRPASSDFWKARLILVRKVENLLGSDGRKCRRAMEQDFHRNFRVNSTWFSAFFSSVLDWIVLIVLSFRKSLPPPPPAQVRCHSTRELRLHVYGKRQIQVERFSK